MSWNKYEHSVSDGQPVRLYEFIHGDIVYYRYTSTDRVITINNTVWEPVSISDNGITTGTDNNEMVVTLPAANPVARLYTGVPPSAPVRLNIHMLHYGDNNPAPVTVWAGTVINRKRRETGAAELVCVSIAATFNRSGIRLTWGRACPYALYDNHCRVKAALYAVSLVITATGGSGITVNMPPGTPDGWFSGGYIEYRSGGVIERRGTRVHSQNNINLFGGATGLTVGQDITVYPGCDLTMETCHTKYNNALNYGGVPHLPDINPWQIIKVF